MNIDEIFDELVETLFVAGNAIMEIYNSDFHGVDKKEDNTPVTIADKKSSDIIQKRLKQLSPDIPIIDEEGEDYDYEVRNAWERFWLIDPLDGTKEFINKSDEFAINLCLLENNIPVLGLIYSPVKELLYYSLKGSGVFKWEIGQKPIKIAPKPIEDNSIKVFTSRSQLKREEIDLIHKIEKSGFDIEKISCSSSIKNGYIAEGKGDIFIKFGKTSEWDTAPGQLMLEELGGTILNLKTLKPLEYNKKNLSNPPFIILQAGEDFQKSIINVLKSNA